MTQRPSTYILAGGLDEVSQPIAVAKGRVIGCLNHESVSTGYGRVGGFERYDGRTSPSAAYIAAPSGTEADSREAARAAIGAVPGSGPVRGVARFKGVLYAWRDNAGGTAGVMYRATETGWSAVPIGYGADFTSGSVMLEESSTITGATSAATATVRRVVVTSGSWDKGDAAGYLVLSGPAGLFTAGEALKSGASNDAATLTAPPVGQAFPAGGRYCTVNNNFYGATNRRELYGCNGVGRGFAFDGEVLVFIRTGMIDDRPSRVQTYKRHLFFAFPGGSVQHSGTGEPLLWQAVYGAGEIAVGSDVTDFVAGIDALHILTVDQINTLTGNDAQDWVLQPLNTEEGHGAVPFAAQTVGTPMYLDAAGFRSIATTQAYGDFKLGTVAPQIHPTIAARRKSGAVPVASLVTKAKDQYRLFYSDGTGVSIYFGRKYPEPMLFEFPRVVTCCCSEFSPTAMERAWIGATDGFVYELDVGTSFDGEDIVAYLQLPWDTEGSLDVLKRWHKVIVEMDASPNTQIGVFAEFDYADGEQSTMPQQNFSVFGGGGLWDSVNWDEFFWSSPAEGRAEAFVDGTGESMAVTLVSKSADQDGYILHAIRKRFSVRGQKR